MIKEIRNILINFPEFDQHFVDHGNCIAFSKLGELQIYKLSQVIGAKKYLYIISHNGLEGYYKIGITNNVEQRFNTFKIASPLGITVNSLIKSNYAQLVEEYVHKMYSHLRENGEWFHFTPLELENVTREVYKLANKNKLQLTTWIERFNLTYG